VSWTVTRHARKRWVERIQESPEVNGDTTRDILRALDESFLIPNRLADRWCSRVRRSLTSKMRRKGLRYRFAGNAVFVLRSTTVTTVLNVAVEDLSTVCVWLMLGHWLEEEPDSGFNSAESA